MIVVLGSINLDLIFAVRDLPGPGETVAAPAMRIEPGGKGGNQALAAARDGAAVAFAGAVGRDRFAPEALALMRAAGVDLSRVAEVDAWTGCASICVDAAGENLIAVASGANLAVRASQVEDGLLGPGSTVLLQMEIDPAETASLIHRARDRGARVILNLAPAGDMPDDTWRAVGLLIANGQEAAWLATRVGTGVNAASLRGALGCDVVVTLGRQGVEAETENGSLRLPAREVEVVDTTAAGDCFAGVLAAGLDRGLDFETALRRANVAAAICCTRHGTQGSLPTRIEIDAALDELRERP